MAVKPSFLATNTDDEGFTPEEREKMDAQPAPEDDAEPEKAPEQETEPEEKPAVESRLPEKAVAALAEKSEHGGDLGKALREERDRRRASDERAERMEKAFQEILKRTSGQPQQQQGDIQQKPAQIPDFNQDPIGNLQGKLAIALERIDQLTGQTQQHRQQTQQQVEYNQFLNQYHASVQAYARTQPDFGEAYNWLAQTAQAQIEARYPDLSHQEVQQRLNAEEENIVRYAFQKGRNPAEAIYNVAKSLGFKKEPAQPENKLARLAAGQKAASSLSGGKNAPNGQDNLSLEYLATLHGDEFDKAWALMEKKGMLG